MAEKIKIIFMGTPEFAVLPLQALLDDKQFEVSAVVTQPDKPAGRSQELTAPPIKVFAQENGLAIFQPEKVRKNPKLLDLLKNLKPYFIITAAYGKILPPEILQIPKICCLNVHASILPKYRGASPIEQALLNGDTESGISFIKMDEKMDTGDVYLIKKVDITADDNNESLKLKLSKTASEALPALLRSIAAGELEATPQNNKNATYCDKIEKNDGLLNPAQMSSIEIIYRIKALNPWPGTFVLYNNKRIKIPDAENATIGESHLPGEFLPYDQNRNLYLFTANGVLKINKMQIEGKKVTSPQDFLRGNGNFFNKSPASAK